MGMGKPKRKDSVRAVLYITFAHILCILDMVKIPIYTIYLYLENTGYD